MTLPKSSSAKPNHLLRTLPWVVAFTPALATLLIILPLRVPIPRLDAWTYVQQYQRLLEGRYSWGEFLSPHYVHPSAVGKIIYFWVLHWCHGNVALLPLLTWAISALISVSVLFQARPLWTGNVVSGTILLFCANLTIFSTAQGEVWIWDFVFQNLIPGLCLTVGLVALSAAVLDIKRISIGVASTIIASFSFGSGFLVGLLFTFSIWQATGGMSPVRRSGLTAAWAGFATLIAWVALRPAVAEIYQTNILDLTDRPAMRFKFILILLGQLFGKGTVFEPEALSAIVGAFLLTVFLVCTVEIVRQRRAYPELAANAMPWILYALYGLGSAVLICMGRMHNTLEDALADRFVSLTLFFALGTLVLAAAVLRHRAMIGQLTIPARTMVGPAIALMLAAHLLNWQRGWNTILLKNRLMEQERAMLSFANVLPPDEEWTANRLTRKSAIRLANYLAGTNRLRSVHFVADTRLTAFRRGAPAPRPWARFEKPVVGDDGQWRLQGIGGLSRTTVANLILISVEARNYEERVIAYTAPLLPETFLERETEVRGDLRHYLGWFKTIHPGYLPRGTVTLRAYVFDADDQVVHPIEGTYEMEVRDV